jgi:hypothetical protein
LRLPVRRDHFFFGNGKTLLKPQKRGEFGRHAAPLPYLSRCRAEESEGIIKKHPTVVFDNLNFLNVTKVACFKLTKSNYYFSIRILFKAHSRHQVDEQAPPRQRFFARSHAGGEKDDRNPCEIE